jgi:hypothetical protein
VKTSREVLEPVGCGPRAGGRAPSPARVGTLMRLPVGSLVMTKPDGACGLLCRPADVGRDCRRRACPWCRNDCAVSEVYMGLGEGGGGERAIGAPRPPHARTHSSVECFVLKRSSAGGFGDGTAAILPKKATGLLGLIVV